MSPAFCAIVFMTPHGHRVSRRRKKRLKLDYLRLIHATASSLAMEEGRRPPSWNSARRLKVAFAVERSPGKEETWQA